MVLVAVSSENASLEPKKRRSNKGKGESFDSPNPVWLHLVDAFRTQNWKRIQRELEQSGILGLFENRVVQSSAV